VSTGIRLWLYTRRIPDLAPLEVEAVRALCAITFRTARGYTKAEWALIDTGSPLSIIPRRVWQQCEVEMLKSYSIRGLVAKEDCVLPVTFGRITCRLMDEQGATQDFCIGADLADTNDVPIVLGFRDALTAGVLHIDGRQVRGYLEL